MGLLRGLFAVAIAGVHIDHRHCRVHLKIIKGGNTLVDEIKTFQTAPNALPIEAAIYLNRIKRKHPFTYVATISHSLYQGVLNASSDKECKQQGVNPADVKRIIIGKKWTAFIDKTAIMFERENFIKAPSLDFLYSPFLLLYQMIRNRLDSSQKLYVLQQNSDVAMLIMDNRQLYLGSIQSLDVDNQVAENIQEEGKETDASNENLEEFGQLDDLDNMTPRDKEGFQDVEESFDSIESQKNLLSDFSRIVAVVNIIKETLNKFYSSTYYDSDFVSEIVIVDGVGTSKKAIEYMQTNLMIDTDVIPIDICQLITEIAQRDLREV